MPPESGNASGRIRGRGFIWASDGCSISFSCVHCPTPSKRHCQATTTTVSKLLPQKPREVKAESSAPAAEGGVLAQEVPSLAISQALEVAIPTHMAPLQLNVGASKGFISARLRSVVRDCPSPGQSFALTHARCIWV